MHLISQIIHFPFFPRHALIWMTPKISTPNCVNSTTQKTSSFENYTHFPSRLITVFTNCLSKLSSGKTKRKRKIENGTSSKESGRFCVKRENYLYHERTSSNSQRAIVTQLIILCRVRYAQLWQLSTILYLPPHSSQRPHSYK